MPGSLQDKPGFSARREIRVGFANAKGVRFGGRNLAEGFKRRTKRDKAHFYNTSQSSLEELRYYFILSKDLGLMTQTPEINELFDHIGRMLNRLIDSLSIDT